MSLSSFGPCRATAGCRDRHGLPSWVHFSVFGTIVHFHTVSISAGKVTVNLQSMLIGSDAEPQHNYYESCRCIMHYKCWGGEFSLFFHGTHCSALDFPFSLETHLEQRAPQSLELQLTNWVRSSPNREPHELLFSQCTVHRKTLIVSLLSHF